MFKKLRNSNGFTLIEIVIVIVIIAILAAILVPSLTSWIDKSKLASMKNGSEQVRGAIMSELYEEYKNNNSVGAGVTEQDYATNDDFWAAVSEKANTNIQCSDDKENGYVTFKFNENGFEYLTYYSNGHTGTYKNGSWTYD